MLDLKTVITKAREAFDQNRLGAQQGYKHCWYYYPGTDHVCAIGASYQPPMEFQRGWGIEQLIAPEEVGGHDNFAVLNCLQMLHDNWCHSPTSRLRDIYFEHRPHSPNHWLNDWLEEHRNDYMGETLFKSFLDEAQRNEAH